jgi:hypothetical protein
MMIDMTLLMVKPHQFGFNQETAATNAFQQKGWTEEILMVSGEEFDQVVSLLQQNDIAIQFFIDTPHPVKPDAIFPNNWFSAHPDGKVILYPMMAPNRRPERRSDVLDWLKKDFHVSHVIDLTHYEEKNLFLEGTGSICFDHVNKMALACVSERTHETVLRDLCQKIGYDYILFEACDEANIPIYHTNVMLWMGKHVACICLDSISSETAQDQLLDFFEHTQRKVIALSHAQVRAFAGNVIEVFDRSGINYFLMSETALRSLHAGQVKALELLGDLLIVSIPTIQSVGGGGIRCMVADIHLPPRR